MRLRNLNILGPFAVITIVSGFAQACLGATPQSPLPEMVKSPTPTITPISQNTLNQWVTESAMSLTQIAGNFATSTAIAENINNPLATPFPDTAERMVISECLEIKVIEACASPISLQEAKQQMIDLAILAAQNKAYMSDAIFSKVRDDFNLLLRAIESYEKNEPGAFPIETYVSLFPEAHGGRNRSEGKQNKIDQITNKVKNPRFLIFIPQITSPGDLDDKNSYFHERHHQAEDYRRQVETGSFKATPEQDDVEELQANFLGDVVEIAIAKGTNALNDPDYSTTVQQNIGEIGHYPPYISWYLDNQNQTSDSPLYRLLFTSQLWFSYKRGTDTYHDQFYIDEEKRIRENWNNYPWTQEEIDLVREMIAQGAAEGWLLPDAFPPLPDSPTSFLTPDLAVPINIFDSPEFESI